MATPPATCRPSDRACERHRPPKALGCVAVAYERELTRLCRTLLLEKLGYGTRNLSPGWLHESSPRHTQPLLRSAPVFHLHGGKDRHPFPVPGKTYIEASINFLRTVT